MVSRTLGLGFVFTALGAGCGWTVAPAAPTSGVEVTSAPAVDTVVDEVPVDDPPVVDIESAPQVVYEGRPTYFYDNQWYFQEGGRWHRYSREPQGLIEHRQRFEAQRGEPRWREQTRENVQRPRMEQRPAEQRQQFARPEPRREELTRPQQRPPVVQQPQRPPVVAQPRQVQPPSQPVQQPQRRQQQQQRRR